MNTQLYPWQQRQWKSLLKVQRKNRLPNALLLSGIAGLGKTEFAKNFVRFLLCNTSSETPCNHCRNCRLLQANNHPDYFNVNLKEKSKNIRVEQIRVVCTSLKQTAQYGGYQIVIIEKADRMDRAAANALLKTLEEPPGKVLIILVSNTSYLLPATVQSRCQTLYFSSQPKEKTIAWLKEQLGDTEQAQLLLKMSENSPFKAIELAKKNSTELLEKLLTHLTDIYKGKRNPIAAVPGFLKSDLSLLLHLFSCLAFDIFRLQLGIQKNYITYEPYFSQLKTLGSIIKVESLSHFLTRIQQAEQQIKSGTNPNTQLLLEDLLLHWVHLCS